MDDKQELLQARIRLTATLQTLEMKLEEVIQKDEIYSGATVAGIIYGNVSNASTLLWNVKKMCWKKLQIK